MKKVTIILTGVILMALNAINVNAQNPTATANASAAANIIVPISIVKVGGKDLSFGNIIADSDGGTVTISSSDAPSSSGINFSSVPGLRQASEFTVSGLANSTYTITTAVIGNLTGPGTEIALSLLAPAVTEGQGTLGTIQAGGTQNFKVGGTITINAGQATGTYTGSFSATVNYN